MERDNNISLSQISAQLYLDRLAGFSESSLLKVEDDYEDALRRTLDFISKILSVDYAFIAEVNEAENNAVFRTVYGVEIEQYQMSRKRADILSMLSKETTIFSVEDEADREIASYLLDSNPIMSGVSIPIRAEVGSAGVLAVYSCDDYKFTQSKVLFMKWMANVVALFFNSGMQLPNLELNDARRVMEAKQEWESAVDSMSQLVIVLNENSNVVRTNRAIQHWGAESVESCVGLSAYQVIKNLKDNEGAFSEAGWNKIWHDLKQLGRLEWETENRQQSKQYRFSLQMINSRETSKRSAHQGYAVLIVDDITRIKDTESRLYEHRSNLGNQDQLRANQVQDLSVKFVNKYSEHEQSKRELLESEARYAQLLKNSMTGICTLKSGRIDVYNDRFAEIFSCEHDIKLANKLFLQLVSGADRKKVLIALSNVVNSIEPIELSVVKARDINHNVLWIEVKFDSLKSANDDDILVYISDITLQKNVELSLKESERRLQKLSSEIINAQENERKRLARDLHDGIGQSLSAIKYTLEGFIQGSDTSSYNEHLGVLDGIVSSIRETIDETRSIAMNLRPSILDDLGIVSAINWFCRQYTETYTNISIEKELYIDESDIDNNRKVAMYRILQEALNNVAKHANASNVRVVLEKTTAGNIHLQISDNGSGISKKIKKSDTKGGMGLYSIQERAELTGGVFTLISNKSGGTVVDVKWVDEVSAIS